MADESGSKPFAEVLRAELEAVAARRLAFWSEKPEAGECVPATAEPADLAAARGAARAESLVGVAFSGGGIRSGTVAIGFLQGLARLRLLGAVDYLSTVSGGGYAGAWFAAWVKREGSLANVEKLLDPSRVREAQATRYVKRDGADVEVPHDALDPEPEPLYHVRAYSRYLTPLPGFLSADTWTLVAIYLRNTLVNQAILLPVFAALVLLLRVAVWLYGQGAEVATPFGAAPGALGDALTPGPAPTWLTDHGVALSFQELATAATLLLPALALLSMVWYRAGVSGSSVAALTPPAARSGLPQRVRGADWVVWTTVLPIIAASVLAVWAFGNDPVRYAARLQAGGTGEVLRYAGVDLLKPLGQLPTRLTDAWQLYFPLESLAFVLYLTGVTAVVGLIGAGLTLWRGAGWGRSLLEFVSSLTLGVALGVTLYSAFKLFVWPHWGDPLLLATFGPPLVMLAFVAAGFIDQALTGKWLLEYEREWRSRVAALVFMAALLWAAFFGAALHLPNGVLRLGELAKLATPAAVAGWAATVYGSVRASRSRSPVAAPGFVRSALIAVGPVVFLAGIVALVSAGVGLVFGWGGDPAPPPGGVRLGAEPGDVGLFWRAALGLVALSVVLTRLSDVNLFSMHSLYGNRLVRCYLAASQRKPHENPVPPAPAKSGPIGVRGAYRDADSFTGFDPGDDFPLCALSRNAHGGYAGPYPLFNATLNLTGGRDLAIQDRRAAPFVMTPDYCGSDLTGYAATPRRERDRSNLTLGRAMTISGAAADANMPLANSFALTALLTVFNARLGWWMQNPRPAEPTWPWSWAAWLMRRLTGRKPTAWAAASPTGGLGMRLFSEFLGRTNETDAYVHLSDGGHFDNSGVYELIRRRCRFVVALDAAEDVNDASENLAAMMRVVRSDFGIRIRIDTSPLKKDAAGLSRCHVAVGTIQYDDVDPGAPAGTFVFVRSSLTGDEPSDLKEYAARDPRFPHHPTLPDQWFDATQFESYRALGYHLAESVFGEAVAAVPLTNLRADTHQREVRRFFSAVRNRWFPPPPDHAAHYAEAGKLFADTMTALRTDPNLAALTDDLYPEFAQAAGAGGASGPELLAVNQLINVMELAWLGVDLDGYYAHPMNRGWMGALHRWSSSEAFHKYWPVLRGEYSKDFVRFCERTLNAAPVRARPDRLGAGAAPSPILVREYDREWGAILRELNRRAPKSPPMPTDLAEVVATAQAGAGGAAPLVWQLLLAEELPRPGGAVLMLAPLAHLQGFPVGLVAAYRRSASAYELVVWLRGAYRSMGLGRVAAEGDGSAGPSLFRRIAGEVWRRSGAAGGEILLAARYPLLGGSSADALQQDLWCNYFSDYGFGRAPDDGDEARQFIEMCYAVTDADANQPPAP